jgi:hypothetical protein
VHQLFLAGQEPQGKATMVVHQVQDAVEQVAAAVLLLWVRMDKLALTQATAALELHLLLPAHPLVGLEAAVAVSQNLPLLEPHRMVVVLEAHLRLVLLELSTQEGVVAEGLEMVHPTLAATAVQA